MSRKAFNKRCDAVTRNFFVKPFKEGKMPKSIEEMFEQWTHEKDIQFNTYRHKSEICEFVRYYLEHEREAINS